MQSPEQKPTPSPEDQELKTWERQRAQVAAHLAWLDACIEKMRSAGASELAKPDSPASTAPENLPENFPESGSPDQALRSARFGCAVLAILAIGGTVFFFFVLPYWIYR